MKRWSKLQHELYRLITPGINFQIHCAVYRRDSRGETGLPRYWITLDREIIWDYPREFMQFPDPAEGGAPMYPPPEEVSAISDLIREYIETPHDEILAKQFKNDNWGLTNILRAADRRVGQRRLVQMRKKAPSQAVLRIIECRLAKPSLVETK